MDGIFCRKLVAITAPSGAGITTLVRELLKTGGFYLITSYTTREPRPSDIPGEYNHLTAKEFDQLTIDDSFAWSVNVHGKRYGTLKSSLNDISVGKEERIALLIVTPVIAFQLAVTAPFQIFRTINIFIIPPDETKLRRRLTLRGSNKEELERRVADCKTWTKEALELGIYIFIQNTGTKDDLRKNFLSELNHQSLLL